MKNVLNCLSSNQRNLGFDNPDEHWEPLTETGTVLAGGIQLEPRYAYPFRESRQKDMGPENPYYHWDWCYYGDDWE